MVRYEYRKVKSLKQTVFLLELCALLEVISPRDTGPQSFC